jgi:hypothetical protein
MLDDQLFTFEIQQRVPSSRNMRKFFITFEIDFNLIKKERRFYNILDFLSDVGGIWSILQSFFWGILAVLNHGQINHYLARKLFKIKGTGDEENELLYSVPPCNLLGWMRASCMTKRCR